MSKRRINIFERHPRITLALFVIILLLLIDFVAGLIFIPDDINSFRAPHYYYHHCLLPNNEAQTTWDAVNYYPFYTNSLGFRDKEIREIELETDSKRILFIGDSHTEGVGVKYEDSFAGIIDEKLEKENIDVLNAAAISYSPKLYYYKIKYLIEEQGLRFDELVVCIDISDIQNELVYKDFEPGESSFFSKLGFRWNKFFKSYSFIYYSAGNIINTQKTKKFYEEAQRDVENPKTDLYSTFFDEFHDSELLRNQQFHNIGLWYLDKDVFEKWGREGMILEKWYMAKLAGLCKDYGIRMYIVVYPWPVQIVAGDVNSIQVQFWQKFSEDYNTGFINLFPVLWNKLPEKNVIKEYYIPGDVHFSEAGHHLVAEEILKYLGNSVN